MTNHHQDAESRIRALEDKRYNAVVTGDFDTFSTLLHPDLRYTHSSGNVDTCQSYLDKFHNGFYVYHHADHPIDAIKVIGSIALVFGEMHANITAGGVRKILHNKVLAVWEQHDGDWKLLAYQPTPIPQ